MPKDSIKATPIHHLGEQRIKVEMPFDKDAIAKIKTVSGKAFHSAGRESCSLVRVRQHVVTSRFEVSASRA